MSGRVALCPIHVRSCRFHVASCRLNVALSRLNVRSCHPDVASGQSKLETQNSQVLMSKQLMHFRHPVRSRNVVPSVFSTQAFRRPLRLPRPSSRRTLGVLRETHVRGPLRPLRLCGEKWPFEIRKISPSTYGPVKRNFGRNRVKPFTNPPGASAKCENIRESFCFPF